MKLIYEGILTTEWKFRLMSRRPGSALTALACTLLTLATSGTPAAAATGTPATTVRQAAAQAAAPCVRPGQATYPVEYYWKNALGMRLGNGSISVDTAPSLWGGQITPGGTFTLTLAHRTARWPLLVRSYTTMWDLSSLLANADIVGQSGAGTISGTTLSIPSPGSKTDPAAKVITFRVRQGTIGNSMTIRPTGISSVIAAPGQLGNNTPAPPIQIVNGQSISPTRRRRQRHHRDGHSRQRARPGQRHRGRTGDQRSHPAGQRHRDDLRRHRALHPRRGLHRHRHLHLHHHHRLRTSTATVTVTVPCPWKPVNLVNGSFEAPPVASIDWSIPDASTNPSTGWHTTATDNKLEFWRGGASGVPAADGQQFAELNANQVSTLYQDVPTVPGTPMTWSLYHRGRLGTDVMRVLIGAPGSTTAQVPTGASSADISDDNTAWRHYTGVYVVPPGQTVTRFAFESVSAAGGSPTAGNFLDGVTFQTPPCP